VTAKATRLDGSQEISLPYGQLFMCEARAETDFGAEHLIHDTLVRLAVSLIAVPYSRLERHGIDLLFNRT
jgi:hypothetical protein